ncbi:hypothetical protein D3C76_1344020 [compost metagenome]
MARFDAGDVQNIADQLQQSPRRPRRHLDGETIHDPLIGFFHGQLKHADHRIHGRADFVAHGGQERGLGTVGLVGFILGFTQLFQ